MLRRALLLIEEKNGPPQEQYRLAKRHSREGGNPVVSHLLGSRLRGNDKLKSHCLNRTALPPQQAKKPEIISRLPQAQPDSSHH